MAKKISFVVPNDELAEFFMEDAAKTEGVIAFTAENGDDFEVMIEDLTIEDV